MSSCEILYRDDTVYSNFITINELHEHLHIGRETCLSSFRLDSRLHYLTYVPVLLVPSLD